MALTVSAVGMGRKPVQYSPSKREQIWESALAGQGSGGNVLAALCSFFVPGLGQLLQGRLVMAIIQFVLAAALWFVLLGWIVHLWSIIDAARFTPPSSD
jgi:TM2 domain-containing membrane protein YozV